MERIRLGSFADVPRGRKLDENGGGVELWGMRVEEWWAGR